MRNEDSVRLIAPLLSENGLDLGSVPPIPSVQLLAADRLGALVVHGVLPESMAPEIRRPELWRTWWAQQKNRYAPVPTALANLEKANLSAEVIAPPSSPGGTPSPRRGARDSKAIATPSAAPSPTGAVRDSHMAHADLPVKDPSYRRTRYGLVAATICGVALILLVRWRLKKQKGSGEKT